MEMGRNIGVKINVPVNVCVFRFLLQKKIIFLIANSDYSDIALN